MRRLCLLLLLAFSALPSASAQVCTGLCLQQIACTGGAATSISGTVYAPNGVDPLPNVLVFIPNAEVPKMSAGVTCLLPGTPPDGSPLVGTITAADGTFKLVNVPAGADIPLVIQSGRWRRQVVVPTTSACTDTAFSARMPRNQAEGDIPQFAIATAGADQVECVLLKVGVDKAEFTNPLSTGRIHLYGDVDARRGGSAGPTGGAVIDANTPLQSTLMSDLNRLKTYDVVMLPCEGGHEVAEPANELSNLVQYANAGGRVYGSHFAYEWMYRNPPFDTVVNWNNNQQQLANGTGTVNPAFYGASTLTSWLQTVNASTSPGQIVLNNNKHDLDGVVAPTQAWITLNDPAHGNQVMQLTFNTPVGSVNQCGRVLFNEYHVEDGANSYNKVFPAECVNTGTMTAQEKLLEYSLFDLTSEGGQPTLTPSSADLGTAYMGFATPGQTFTWKNNSIFAATVPTVATSGDFRVLSNACKNVASGASCLITVAYQPTAPGPATGTLTVVSDSSTQTAALTGNGVQALVLSTSNLTFGNTDVGATATLNLELHNVAAGPVPLTGVVPPGDFTVTSNCGSTLAGGASCAATVAFKPSATGPRTGGATFNGLVETFGGNGVDFSAVFTPASGTVIAGLGVTAPVTVLPIADFSARVALSCTTNAPASTCLVNTPGVVPSAAAGVSVTVTTTAKYAVIGYGGAGRWKLAIFALGAGLLLWRRREFAGKLTGAVLLLLLGVGAAGLSGCGSKTPGQNVSFTAAGPYTYTVTGTDGFLVHSATYSLAVTSK